MKLTRVPIVLLIFGPVLSGCDGNGSSQPSDAGTAQDADASVPDAAAPMRPLSPLVDVCPRPNAPLVIGDSNGDGVMDVADAVALQNNVIRGRRDLVCSAAANFDGD